MSCFLETGFCFGEAGIFGDEIVLPFLFLASGDGVKWPFGLFSASSFLDFLFGGSELEVLSGAFLFGELIGDIL